MPRGVIRARRFFWFGQRETADGKASRKMVGSRYGEAHGKQVSGMDPRTRASLIFLA
jgi:hypothetical protein